MDNNDNSSRKINNEQSTFLWACTFLEWESIMLFVRTSYEKHMALPYFLLYVDFRSEENVRSLTLVLPLTLQNKELLLLEQLHLEMVMQIEPWAFPYSFPNVFWFGYIPSLPAILCWPASMIYFLLLKFSKHFRLNKTGYSLLQDVHTVANGGFFFGYFGGRHVPWMVKCHQNEWIQH